jgi:tRNA (guanine37-N1)-methyltransferase
LSAKGKKWNQQLAKKYSKMDKIILICGRYEGIDERIKKFVDEEISIGDYVLTGGEIPAMTIVDSITRLLPGVLGNADSPIEESHSTPGILEYPQYTKPEIFTVENKKYKVPKILLSGHHQKIRQWRINKQKKVLPR